MSQAVIGTLEQQRRDALVAYYLGKLVGQGSTPNRIATENDLYEYLLIDNQVSAQVDTSRVAQGIASVQQHIHAIYNGMEPGYSGVSDEQLTLWREGMAQYSLWSGYQMLQDYPENYLDPTLRLDKTTMFKTFESELAQARLSKDAVQRALGNYLQAFETVSNLKITGCYVDSPNFLDADYYFIGRQSIEPFAFYWRKSRLYKGEPANKSQMLGWTEWLAIESIGGAQIKYCRPVVMDGRLYAVWVETGKPLLNAEGSKTGHFEYHMKLSYRRLDGSWGAPILLHSGEVYDDVMESEVGADGVISKGYRLAVSTDHGHHGKSRLLVRFMTVGEFGADAPPFVSLMVRDVLLNLLSITDTEKVHAALAFMLGTDSRRVQFCTDQLEGDQVNGWRISSVVRDENAPPSMVSMSDYSLNDSLELQAEWQSGHLMLQGFCGKTLTRRKGSTFKCMATIRYSGTFEYYVHVDATQPVMWFGVYIRLAQADQPEHISAKLIYRGEELKLIEWEDFELEPPSDNFKHYSAKKIIDRDPDSFEDPLGSFSVWFSNSRTWALNASDNYYTPRYEPLTMTWGVAHYEDSWIAREDTVLLNGAAKTPMLYHQWPASAGNQRTYQWGEYLGNSDGFGLNGFTVIREPISAPVPYISITATGAQYLDLTAAGVEASTANVRLNTLFAKELTRMASLSMESALSWETQHTEEPLLPGQTAPVYVDFAGANGLYFWELFFHAAHLVAWRLQKEFDYSGAQRWLHYLFNPQMRVAPQYPPPTETEWLPYWNCRPLGMADNVMPELEGLTNPDAIARGVPSHYRKAIFMLYLNNLIDWGDMLYRQVTRDTLNEAKLHYVRALSLLGPLSKGRSISLWAPVTLAQASQGGGTSFAAAESANVDVLRTLVPMDSATLPWLRLLDTQVFRLPVNSQLLDVWDRLEQRLYNLRNNLTLDGKPLQMALYEAPANPLDLLRAQLSGSSLSQRRLGSLAIIPSYRFRAMLPRVQNSVDTLIRYGQQVLGYMELRDRAQQEELQQGHVLDDLVRFAEQLQQDAVDQASKGLEMVNATKATVLARKNYYDGLVSVDVSESEKSAQTARGVAKDKMGVVRSWSKAGHYGSYAPNLFGMTFGGVNWGGALFAQAEENERTAADTLEAAQRELTSDMQRRRREEWQYQAKQAELEMGVIDWQISAQKVALQAATASREQAIKTREQAQELYAFIKNRASGAGLYQWLLSQMSTLYFQAYDAVLGMCLGAEACWQYEIGDRDTRFISTTAWVENRFGLTAGETLKLGLLQMESAFLARNERRLELTKTISLKALLSDYDPNTQAGGALATGWEGVIEMLKGNGEVDFQLKPSTFDKDYPGHYLRQLIRVSISLPGLLKPYQDIHATLSQQTSSYLLQPQIDNVKYLYVQAGDLPEEEGTRQDQIVSNPRPNQQIGISTGVDDDGMFMLDFGDERYLPFEGTGAVSRWTLSFPSHESVSGQTMLESLPDIILHIRYLAVDGGQVFSREVEELVADVEAGEETRRRSLASMSTQKLLN
ncbi:hypothetical protein AUC61_18485 [Pseudomonas sp. S25]|uniref:Insecticidal toxin complex protein TccB n=2 Tax=Pseudomonas maioricensis TaxID=1766623 RepID=A0ABS9ZLR6_9PSED|nr:hypothetical protein [Pseudomonas sp. S25]